MAALKTVFNFTRLNSSSHIIRCGISTSNGPSCFKVTTCLFAEPSKRKKKVDVQVVIQRELKKKRKLEKAVTKLLAKGRNLKPIDEYEPDKNLMKNLDKRKREVPVFSFEESEERALLIKEWTRHKWQEHKKENDIISKAIKAQNRALVELRKESEELYQMAIQPDESLIPYTCTGPNNTPAIQNYDPPDGEYVDTTKKYDKIAAGEINVTKLKIRG